MKGLLVGVALSGLIFGGIPLAHAEPDGSVYDQVCEDEPGERGLKCRRECEDGFAQDTKDCDRLPPGLLRNACHRRANDTYRACLWSCPDGPRDCLDDDTDKTTSDECRTPLQSES